MELPPTVNPLSAPGQQLLDRAGNDLGEGPSAARSSVIFPTLIAAQSTRCRPYLVEEHTWQVHQRGDPAIGQRMV
jgi:hypothetical protein